MLNVLEDVINVTYCLIWVLNQKDVKLKLLI